MHQFRECPNVFCSILVRTRVPLASLLRPSRPTTMTDMKR